MLEKKLRWPPTAASYLAFCLVPLEALLSKNQSFKKDLFIKNKSKAKNKQNNREGVKERSFIFWFCKSQVWTRLRPGTRTPVWFLLQASRGFKYFRHLLLLCLPIHINRKLDMKQSNEDLDLCSNLRCWFHKLKLSVMHHKAGISIMFLCIKCRSSKDYV